MRLLQSRQADPFSSAHTYYSGMRKPGIMIVTFDVPEKEKRKREWLRECLRLLGFKKLHKSVWMGKEILPEDFIHALRERDMIGYVHILAVDKRGTTEELWGG